MSREKIAELEKFHRSLHDKRQAGSHQKAIRMAMKDYINLVKPKVMEFSYQST